MSKLSFRAIIDGFEHAPGSVLKCGVTGDAVEDEDGFDGFRPASMSGRASVAFNMDILTVAKTADLQSLRSRAAIHLP